MTIWMDDMKNILTKIVWSKIHGKWDFQQYLVACLGVCVKCVFIMELSSLIDSFITYKSHESPQLED